MPLPIVTERLRLRPPVPGDLAPLRAVYCDERAMRYITRRALNDDEIRERLETRMRFQRERGYTFWIMERLEDDAILGVCGLVPIERKGPEIEVGYHLAPFAWGRGYATEGARASIRFAFTETDLDKVVAVAETGNVASHRVLAKAGLSRLGERHFYNEDLAYFEIQRADWMRANEVS